MGDRLVGTMAGVWLAALFAAAPIAWFVTRWLHWRDAFRTRLLQ